MPSLDLELSTSSLSIVYREQFPAEASSFDQEKGDDACNREKYYQGNGCRDSWGE